MTTQTRSGKSSARATYSLFPPAPRYGNNTEFRGQPPRPPPTKPLPQPPSPDNDDSVSISDFPMPPTDPVTIPQFPMPPTARLPKCLSIVIPPLPTYADTFYDSPSEYSVSEGEVEISVARNQAPQPKPPVFTSKQLNAPLPPIPLFGDQERDLHRSDAAAKRRTIIESMKKPLPPLPAEAVNWHAWDDRDYVEDRNDKGGLANTQRKLKRTKPVDNLIGEYQQSMAAQGKAKKPKAKADRIAEYKKDRICYCIVM